MYVQKILIIDAISPCITLLDVDDGVAGESKS